jgi:hypothetical protein
MVFQREWFFVLTITLHLGEERHGQIDHDDARRDRVGSLQILWTQEYSPTHTFGEPSASAMPLRTINGHDRRG